MNTEPIERMLSGPLALQLASAGAELAPESVRGFGIEYDAARALVSFIVLDAQSARFRAAVASSRQLAVNLTNPVTFVGIQIKGPVLSIDEPSSETAAAAARYFDGFSRALLSVGFEPHQLRGFFHGGAARFIRMRPTHLFNQTPGTGAGRPL